MLSSVTSKFNTAYVWCTLCPGRKAAVYSKYGELEHSVTQPAKTAAGQPAEAQSLGEAPGTRKQAR